MKKYFFILFVILLTTIILASHSIVLAKQPDAYSNQPDIEIKINQDTINEFLNKTDKVSRQSTLGLPFIDISYTWTVSNPRINITTDNARFVADVLIESELFNYTTEANGIVDLFYNEDTDKICLVARKVFFELDLSFLGEEYDIYDIDITRFYQPRFCLDAPNPFQPFIRFQLPIDETIKVYVKNTYYSLRYEPRKVIVEIYYDFSSTPPDQQ